VSGTVVVGTFDGVHLGHRRVVETALATGLPVTALTFHPHPRAVVQGNLVELVCSLERRVELLRELGVAEVVVVTTNASTRFVDCGGDHRWRFSCAGTPLDDGVRFTFVATLLRGRSRSG